MGRLHYLGKDGDLRLYTELPGSVLSVNKEGRREIHDVRDRDAPSWRYWKAIESALLPVRYASVPADQPLDKSKYDDLVLGDSVAYGERHRVHLMAWDGSHSIWLYGVDCPSFEDHTSRLAVLPGPWWKQHLHSISRCVFVRRVIDEDLPLASLLHDWPQEDDTDAIGELAGYFRDRFTLHYRKGLWQVVLDGRHILCQVSPSDMRCAALLPFLTATHGKASTETHDLLMALLASPGRQVDPPYPKYEGPQQQREENNVKKYRFAVQVTASIHMAAGTRDAAENEIKKRIKLDLEKTFAKVEGVEISLELEGAEVA